MPVPNYFRKYSKNVSETDYTTFSLVSSTGNDLFEIWYYGDLYTIQGETEPLIVSTDFAPAKIIAKDFASSEQITIFDGTCFGYDNMFCDEYTKNQINNRPLQKLAVFPVKVNISLYYGIDYDNEKDDYDFDDNGMVLLINGSIISWEDVKSNGFDGMSITIVNDEKIVEILSEELA